MKLSQNKKLKLKNQVTAISLLLAGHFIAPFSLDPTPSQSRPKYVFHISIALHAVCP